MAGKVLASRRRAEGNRSRRPAIATLQERTLPEILRRLESGEGLNGICRSDGMPSKETVRRWCDQDRAVAERIYEARETGFFDRAERAVQAAKTAKDPQLGRLAFDAERWFLGKLSTVFAERAPKIETQTNITAVSVDASTSFQQIAAFMDRAAAGLASGAVRTNLVAGEGEAGPGGPGGGLDDVAAIGGPRVG